MGNNIVELTVEKIYKLVGLGTKISELEEMTIYEIDKIRVVERLLINDTLDVDLYINGVMASSTTNGDNTTKVFVILRDLYYEQENNEYEFVLKYLKS